MRARALIGAAVAAATLLIPGTADAAVSVQPVPPVVLAFSTTVNQSTPSNTYGQVIDVDYEFPYADGGVMIHFDNGLSLAFMPRYMQRSISCWNEDKPGWMSKCSADVFRAYHWKRDLIREFNEEER